MDLKQIEKLMMAMRRYGTKRLLLKREGFEIELEREGEPPQSPMTLPQELIDAAAMKAAKEQKFHLPKSETPPIHKSDASVAEVAEGEHVVSPMVGTFYRGPSPSDPPFVKVGDTIDENSVVCIVEAMKVMNEIKAGVTGTVKEVLIEDGHPVEFGTKLFKVD